MVASAGVPIPVLGWLMGALIPIEPDHLCSLIALNAGQRKAWPAFVGGAQWGLGHSVGMIVFCLIFLPLQKLITLDVWEFYGNYLAGLLLIGIGIYFLTYESKYLEIDDDGSWVPKKDACCCCHGAEHESQSLCAAYRSAAHGPGSCGDHRNHSSHDELDPESSENSPLLTDKADEAGKPAGRFSLVDLRGALIGLLQGLLCPSCIASLAFVGQMGAQDPSGLEVMSFFAVCFLSLVVCSALISSSVVAFASQCSLCCPAISTRTVFWASCGISILLGVTWIVLNATGTLHVIEYTHPIEEKLHGMAGLDMGHMTMR